MHKNTALIFSTGFCEMIKWPTWLALLLFYRRGITWDWTAKTFRTYGQIMHFSPIDSSFTYLRIYLKIGDWYKYPVTCTAGYQPNAGMKLCIWHKEIFDCRRLAQRRVAAREGWVDWKDKA